MIRKQGAKQDQKEEARLKRTSQAKSEGASKIKRDKSG